MIEIGAYEDRDGAVQFHPHVHALVAGVPKKEISTAFKSRKSSKQRSRAKPVYVARLASAADIASRLLYMTKFKAQLSYPHESKSSHGSRSDETMPSDFHAERMKWLSGYTIADVFSLTGISPDLTMLIYNAKMELIVRRFLKITASGRILLRSGAKNDSTQMGSVDTDQLLTV